MVGVTVRFFALRLFWAFCHGLGGTGFWLLRCGGRFWYWLRFWFWHGFRFRFRLWLWFGLWFGLWLGLRFWLWSRFGFRRDLRFWLYRFPAGEIDLDCGGRCRNVR